MFQSKVIDLLLREKIDLQTSAKFSYALFYVHSIELNLGANESKRISQSFFSDDNYLYHNLQFCTVSSYTLYYNTMF